MAKAVFVSGKRFPLGRECYVRYGLIDSSATDAGMIHTLSSPKKRVFHVTFVSNTKKGIFGAFARVEGRQG